MTIRSSNTQTGRRLLFMDLMVFSLSFYPFPFLFFFTMRALDVHTGRESIKGSYARVRRERESSQEPKWASQFTYRLARPTKHHRSNWDAFFRSALTRTSPFSLELFQTARGVIFQAPSKKRRFSVHVPYTTNPPVIIRKLLLCYYYYPWMDGVGSSSSTSEKIKRSEGEKTVSQESFYIAAACCV